MFLVGIISYIKDKKDFKKIVLIGFSNKEKKNTFKDFEKSSIFFFCQSLAMMLSYTQ